MLMVILLNPAIRIQRPDPRILVLEVRCAAINFWPHVLTAGYPPLLWTAYNITTLNPPALPNPMPSLNFPVQLYAGIVMEQTFQITK